MRRHRFNRMLLVVVKHRTSDRRSDEIRGYDFHFDAGRQSLQQQRFHSGAPALRQP